MSSLLPVGVGLLVVAILLAVLTYYGRRPHRIRNVQDQRLHTMLGELLDSGYDGGFLMIEVAGSEQFIQFAKYIHGERGAGIQLDFPRAPWSADYFDAIVADAQSADLNVALEPGKGQVSMFLVVDFYRNVDVAHRFAVCILREHFSVPEGGVNAYLANVSPRVERIGFSTGRNAG